MNFARNEKREFNANHLTDETELNEKKNSSAR